MNDTTTDTPRIYVASLSDYNDGTLHGVWIDLDDGTTDDEVAEAIAAMLATGAPGAEEYAIHDHEGFGGLTIGEYEPIANVVELAQAIHDHAPYHRGAVAAFVAYEGEWDSGRFDDAFVGCYDSEEALAEEYVEMGLFGEIPEAIASYIDTDKIARDLFMDDYYSADDPEGGIFVFRRY